MVVAGPAQVSRRGIEGPPLLVVEILSPTTTVYDRTTKSRRYATLGIEHYWILDPETQQLECYRRDGSSFRQAASAGPAATLTHPDFPGLQLPLAPLWR
jgi:Uma2 family endonuclease